jgi:hypothetical protein
VYTESDRKQTYYPFTYSARVCDVRIVLRKHHAKFFGEGTFGIAFRFWHSFFTRTLVTLPLRYQNR